MGFKEELSFAPGYSGFIPTLGESFGHTFGIATKQILDENLSLKQGRIQKEREAAKAARRAAAKQPEHNVVWGQEKTWATGDDRFSFPPVPGYTGYIPRSKEHFGHSYVQTTSESLSEFQGMMARKNELPPRVKAVKNAHQPLIPEPTYEGDQRPHLFQYTSYAGSPSPSRLPGRDAPRTFPSGYTGFVPRKQNIFGESYSASVKKAIDEFTAPKQAVEDRTRHEKALIHKQPIPGFTGFIPSASRTIAQTFGRTTLIAYDSFNNRDERGKPAPSQDDVPIAKKLKDQRPIPGYRGHIPGKQDL
ncbi:hypothetical protein SmJEL517_g01715 [Synchytrium microbalum]|uniref:Ciliary microtubule inner protein 2A-C-like domain-containing protein n=1 Tax=Synchytrium microbalum TaxID=1806994 RepID=A0A507C9L5_9FUNG|nr:uncharacterized protein SmJEL517_g01715 [Synchytrium microbalum]TPX36038.1 hypothetical protein SmJEL517_g01715 [Synchytrium microbalum]